METIDLVKKDWRKSTYSNPSGNCVEVAENVPGRVYIRDSKHPEIGHLDIPANEWYGIVRWLGNFCPEPVSAN